MKGERAVWCGRALALALAGLAGLVAPGCRAPVRSEPAALPSPRVPAAGPIAAGPIAAQGPEARGAPTLEARLGAHAVGRDDFVRLELYTWTTPAQIEALRAGGPLLVADAQAGGHPSPYHRLLAAMDEERRPGHALASALRHAPELSRCRYAWPSPLATVLGRGAQRYGSALVRVRLRDDAVIARLDPRLDAPWLGRDAEGHALAEAELAAAPGRVGAVFHLRVEEPAQIPFREYVLCNPAMIEAWEVGTPAIAARVEAERRLVLDLGAGPFAALPEAHARWPAWPQWLEDGEPPAWPSRWHRALAFDNARYRPTPAALEALAQALADYDPTPPALAWPPDDAAASQAAR